MPEGNQYTIANILSFVCRHIFQKIRSSNDQIEYRINNVELFSRRSSIPVGTIISVLGQPRSINGYIICDGRECLESQYPALSSLFVVFVSEAGVYNSERVFRVPSLNQNSLMNSSDDASSVCYYVRCDGPMF